MGSARVAQEARDQAATLNMQRDIQHQKDLLEEKRREFEARKRALEAEFHTEENTIKKGIEQAEQDLDLIDLDRKVMARERTAGPVKKARGD